MTLGAMASLLLCACSSAHKKAEKFMDAGLYDDAARVYEEILTKSSDDEDAVIGLKKARDASVDKRLIEVRMARLGGNQDLALNLLLQVVELEKQWKLIPAGKVAFTQDEEKAFGLQFFQAKIGRDLREKKPLRGEYSLRKYRTLFSGEPSGRYRALQSQVQELGKNHCQTEWKKDLSKGKPFYTLLLKQVCSFWGETVSVHPDDLASLGALLFGSIQVRAKIEGLSEESRALWEEGVSKVFRGLAWFDQVGKKKLDVVITGSLLESKSKNSRHQIHYYSVSEPYTEYVKVRKAIAGQPGKYTEEVEKRTSYRSVQKEHPYLAYEIEQILKLNVNAPVALGEPSPILVGQSGETSAKGIEHYENIPMIGLSSKRVTLESPVAFANEQGKLFIKKFEKSLKSRWVELFCGSNALGGGPTEGAESAAKCLRQRTEEPIPLIDEWLQKVFGIQSQELRQMQDWAALQING